MSSFGSELKYFYTFNSTSFLFYLYNVALVKVYRLQRIDSHETGPDLRDPMTGDHWENKINRLLHKKDIKVVVGSNGSPLIPLFTFNGWPITWTRVILVNLKLWGTSAYWVPELTLRRSPSRELDFFLRFLVSCKTCTTKDTWYRLGNGGFLRVLVVKMNPHLFFIPHTHSYQHPDPSTPLSTLISIVPQEEEMSVTQRDTRSHTGYKELEHYWSRESVSSSTFVPHNRTTTPSPPPTSVRSHTKN